MSISKVRARSVKHAVLSGDEQASKVLSSTNTTQIIEFTGPTSQISLQSSGDLAFTYAPSLNSQNFGSPVSVAANVIATYNDSNLGVLQLSWVSGSGVVTILAT